MALNCVYARRRPSNGRRRRVGFYDLWPRHRSEDFIYEISHYLLGDSCPPLSDSKFGLYEVYRQLPPVDLSTSSLALIQTHALFSKSDDMKSPIDKEAVAYDSFVTSEKTCANTNLLLDDLRFRGRSDIAPILHHAQRYVAAVLGVCPNLDEFNYRFGPGAVSGSKDQKNTSARWKLSGSQTCSNSLLGLIPSVRSLFPHWLSDREITPVCGRLEFVPKSFKTYRSILVEPSLNALLQKGVGSFMKRQLLRVGIDLYDQSKQRERARLGSLGSDFVTIDLSRASDSICVNLVRELLPLDWYDLLFALRTPLVTYRRKLIVLEKFSSMGNGFTFELESLIFKALVRGIAATYDLDDDASVYGDDIICNSALGARISELFPSFGFELNKDKSYLDGPFRESCGGDYRNGIDVRPFFVRGLRDGGRFSDSKAVIFHNFLQRKPWFDPDRVIRKMILGQLQPHHKVFGPDGYGDCWLVSHAHPSTYLPACEKNSLGWEISYVAKGFGALPWKNTEACDGDSFLPFYLIADKEQSVLSDLTWRPFGRRLSSLKALDDLRVDYYNVRYPKGERLRSRAFACRVAPYRGQACEDTPTEISVACLVVN